MNLSFNTKKYYSKNVKISKMHGVFFMVVGLIILISVFYGVFQLWVGLDSSFGSMNCDESAYLKTNIDEAFSDYDSKKGQYESIKESYYGAINIDSEVEKMGEWNDALYEMIVAYNRIVNVYNMNIEYYETCYSSVSQGIDATSAYIDNEESVIDIAFSELKPKAESEGYVYGSDYQDPLSNLF